MYSRLLEITSHWAAILTAGVATVAYGRYVYDRLQRRLKLEKHLLEEQKRGIDRGQRTVLHLMSRLRMTESEILDAAFRSNHVCPAVTVDEQGRAEDILIEYDV